MLASSILNKKNQCYNKLHSRIKLAVREVGGQLRWCEEKEQGWLQWGFSLFRSFIPRNRVPGHHRLSNLLRADHLDRPLHPSQHAPTYPTQKEILVCVWGPYFPNPNPNAMQVLLTKKIKEIYMIARKTPRQCDGSRLCRTKNKSMKNNNLRGDRNTNKQSHTIEPPVQRACLALVKVSCTMYNRVRRTEVCW
jgi:hypothetical protein